MILASALEDRAEPAAEVSHKFALYSGVGGGHEEVIPLEMLKHPGSHVGLVEMIDAEEWPQDHPFEQALGYVAPR
jgi:hypothetical protein